MTQYSQLLARHQTLTWLPQVAYLLASCYDAVLNAAVPVLFPLSCPSEWLSLHLPSSDVLFHHRWLVSTPVRSHQMCPSFR